MLHDAQLQSLHAKYGAYLKNQGPVILQGYSPAEYNTGLTRQRDEKENRVYTKCDLD